MLREAELLVQAERVLIEVLGRIRPSDRATVLPPLRAGSPRSTTMHQAVEQHVRDDAALVVALGGVAPLPGSDVGAAGQAVCDTARGLRTAGPSEREELLTATVARALLAHYVAAHLGSTACPLPEELARPLWELTAPEAEHWRALGWFREPLPLPPHVSWRDRFLLTAGHPAHPLGH